MYRHSVAQYHTPLPGGDFDLSILHNGQLLTTAIPYASSQEAVQRAIQAMSPDFTVSLQQSRSVTVFLVS